MNKETPDPWIRLRIDDPHLASSESFASLLRRILKHISVAAVVIERFEGVRPSDQPTARLEEPSVVLSPEVLAKQLELYTQLVWGRFFLIKNTTMVKPNMKLEQTIAASETTVCVSDNVSYFVFTRSKPLADDLLSNYELSTVAEGNLSELLALPEEL
jgi:hypothetical protein